MARIVEFRLPEGECVLVEAVDPPKEGGEERAAIDTLGKYLSGEENGGPADLAVRVSPVIAALKTVKEKLAIVGNVKQVELQAGLKFIGEAGVVLSKIGSEASVSIKLVWEQSGTAK
jgi:hypothetical protein